MAHFCRCTMTIKRMTHTIELMSYTCSDATARNVKSKWSFRDEKTLFEWCNFLCYLTRIKMLDASEYDAHIRLYIVLQFKIRFFYNLKLTILMACNIYVRLRLPRLIIIEDSTRPRLTVARSFHIFSVAPRAVFKASSVLRKTFEWHWTLITVSSKS